MGENQTNDTVMMEPFIKVEPVDDLLFMTCIPNMSKRHMLTHGLSGELIVNHAIHEQPRVSLIRPDLLDPQILAQIQDCQAFVDLTHERLPFIYSHSASGSSPPSSLVQLSHSSLATLISPQNSPKSLPMSLLLNASSPPLAPPSLGSTGPDSIDSGSPRSDSSNEDDSLFFRNSPLYLDFTDIEQVQSVISGTLLSYWTKTEIASISKLMIKKLEPFKQTKYPYKEGDKRKPTWWPDSLHREPDHLGKPGVTDLFLHLISVTMFYFAHSHGIEPTVKDPTLFEKADFSRSCGIFDQHRPFSYLTQEITPNACWADRPSVKVDAEIKGERNRILGDIWNILRSYEAYCLGEICQDIMPIIPCPDKRGPRRPRPIKRRTMALPSPALSNHARSRPVKRRSTTERPKRTRKFAERHIPEDFDLDVKPIVKVDVKRKKSSLVVLGSTPATSTSRVKKRNSDTSRTFVPSNDNPLSVTPAQAASRLTGSMDLDHNDIELKTSLPRNSASTMLEHFTPQPIPSLDTFESSGAMRNVMANEFTLPRSGAGFPNQMVYNYACAPMMPFTNVVAAHMPLSYMDGEAMEYDAFQSSEILFHDSDSSSTAANSPYPSPNSSFVSSLSF